MNRKTSALVAGTATALVFGLVGCGASEPSKVSGALDDVKHLRSVAAKTKQVPKTKKVCTRRVKGVCKSSATRPDGTKTETIKPAKPARWCVELDNVNGDKDRDDVWFEVSSGTYNKWDDEDEGVKVVDMTYSREVASCKN